MIKDFKCKETKNIFSGEYSKKFPFDIQRIAMRKLLIIDSAISLNDLRIPPSNNLEKLKGKMKGNYSIRINDKWRICFSWKNEDAYNVYIIDYHK